MDQRRTHVRYFKYRKYWTGKLNDRHAKLVGFADSRGNSDILTKVCFLLRIITMDYTIFLVADRKYILHIENDGTLKYYGTFIIVSLKIN